MAKKRKEAAKKPAGEGERDGREGCLPDDVAVGRKEGLAFLAVHSRPGNCRAHGPSAAAWRRLLTSATLSGPFVASCRTAPWSLSATLRHSCVFPLAFRHHVHGFFGSACADRLSGGQPGDCCAPQWYSYPIPVRTRGELGRLPGSDGFAGRTTIPRR